jgi:hypothetical protein
VTSVHMYRAFSGVIFYGRIPRAHHLRSLKCQLSAFSVGSAKHQPRTGWGEVSEYTS